MPATADIDQLSFTVSGRIARPRHEVYEAVADPAVLSRYFTTGGAQGRLEPDTDVSWDFHDFPGAFPVTVIAATAPSRIVLAWGATLSANDDGQNRVTFTFEPLDDDARTLVTISESAWSPTPEGAKAAFANCEGWTGMLAAMKAWLEHGVVLRHGFYR